MDNSSNVSNTTSDDPKSFWQFVSSLRLKCAKDFAEYIAPRPLFPNFSSFIHRQRVEEADALKPKPADEDEGIFDRIADRMNHPEDEQYEMEVDEGVNQIEELIKSRKQPIADDELRRIEAVLRGPASSEVIIDKFNIDMTRSKIVCLRKATWLNDEVINFYMSMLQERNTKYHYFNSFFLVKLVENGKYCYNNVKRWTKKFNILEKEKIFIPVNLGNTHWTMMVIHMTAKQISYYDSMSGSGRRHMNAVLQWIKDDVQDKLKQSLDMSDWKIIDESKVPQQRNGYDCGVFSIMCADYVSDNLPLVYTQDEMIENRLKIGAAILRGSLNY